MFKWVRLTLLNEINIIYIHTEQIRSGGRRWEIELNKKYSWDDQMLKYLPLLMREDTIYSTPVIFAAEKCQNTSLYLAFS